MNNQPTVPNPAPQPPQLKRLVPAILILLAVSGIAAAAYFRYQPAPAADTKTHLEEALTTSLGQPGGLELNYEPKTRTAVLTQSEEDDHAFGSAINLAHTLLRRFGAEAFGIDDVEHLTVVEKIGGSEAVKITISKQNYYKIDWKGLIGKPAGVEIKKYSSSYEVGQQAKEFAQPDELR